MVPKHCVAFIVDCLAIPGLRAAVVSCVEQLFADTLSVPIIIFYVDAPKPTLLSIIEDIRRIWPSQHLELRAADVSEYRSLLPLHGSLTMYFKLSLPERLPDYDEIVYVDADTLIVGSVRKLCEMDLGSRPLAAVGGGIMHALECVFFRSLGYGDEDFGFNSGVLILNGRIWREMGLKEKCKEFGRRHYADCKSAEQTILVGMFSREFVRLPAEFNVSWGPWQKADPTRSVIHFVGSPKPWDFAGCWLHSGYRLWRTYARRGGHSGLSFWWSNGASILRRTWHIRRSLARAFLRKIGVKR